MFDFLKRKPKRFRQFAAYIDPFMRHSQLAMELLQKANEFGLRGQKIQVVVRHNKEDHMADEIWFEGELK